MTEQREEQPLDRKDLKIQALLEKISNLTTQYENQVADLRVNFTVSSQESNAKDQRIQELENEVTFLRNQLDSYNPEVVEGEVVEGNAAETEENQA